MARPSSGVPSMETIRSDDLMTAKEMADHLGVKPGTILGWYRQGKIPARKLSHKVLRFNLHDVLAALEANKTARGERGEA
jgi:excisionase family DNA binding protein